jgi:hypothetical protein
MLKKEEVETKKKYEPPRIRRIKLTPDELASTGCKSTGPVCRMGGVYVNLRGGS